MEGLTREEAVEGMKRKLREEMGATRIKTKVQTWKGRKWLTLVTWTDSDEFVHQVAPWSFVRSDPTEWSHAISLNEPPKGGSNNG